MEELIEKLDAAFDEMATEARQVADLYEKAVSEADDLRDRLVGLESDLQDAEARASAYDALVEKVWDLDRGIIQQEELLDAVRGDGRIVA